MVLSVQYICVVSSSLVPGLYQLGFSYMQLLISQVITNLVTLSLGILLDHFLVCSIHFLSVQNCSHSNGYF